MKSLKQKAEILLNRAIEAGQTDINYGKKIETATSDKELLDILSRLKLVLVCLGVSYKEIKGLIE